MLIVERNPVISRSLLLPNEVIVPCGTMQFKIYKLLFVFDTKPILRGNVRNTKKDLLKNIAETVLNFPMPLCEWQKVQKAFSETFGTRIALETFSEYLCLISDLAF